MPCRGITMTPLRTGSGTSTHKVAPAWSLPARTTVSNQAQHSDDFTPAGFTLTIRPPPGLGFVQPPDAAAVSEAFDLAHMDDSREVGTSHSSESAGIATESDLPEVESTGASSPRSSVDTWSSEAAWQQECESIFGLKHDPEERAMVQHIEQQLPTPPDAAALPAWRGGSHVPPPPFAPLSVGSAAHFLGTCRPCDFTYRNGSCRAGTECRFCHLCGPEVSKRLKKQRKQRLLVLKKNGVADD